MKFRNRWTVTGDRIKIESSRGTGSGWYDAAHDILGGYYAAITTAGCWFDGCVSGACGFVIFNSQGTAAAAVENVGRVGATSRINTDQTLNVGWCGDGEINPGHGEQCEPPTAGCLANCTWETTPPISTIGTISPLPGHRASDNTDWLKANTYTISITDEDNPGGSGIDPAQCKYKIDDLGRTGEPGETPKSRSCNSSIDITVGPTGDCQTQDKGMCIIIAMSKDKAGNPNDTSPVSPSYRPLNIDYTPPTVK